MRTLFSHIHKIGQHRSGLNVRYDNCHQLSNYLKYQLSHIMNIYVIVDNVKLNKAGFKMNTRLRLV